MYKAVFLDKDGTLTNDVPYNVKPEFIWFLPGVVEGLQLLEAAGYKLIIVSNQSGIAHGHFNENDIVPVRQTIESGLAYFDIRLDGFYYCPHHPHGLIEKYAIPCICRKPAPGMFINAKFDHDIDLSQSWMVGDILHDIEAGNRAGCKTVLINNGNETEWLEGEYREPTIKVNNFWEAAKTIMSKSEIRSTKFEAIRTEL
jgi:D-glycero-D-manno-heptose 1,7-bisphosphate phosphatase